MEGGGPAQRLLLGHVMIFPHISVEKMEVAAFVAHSPVPLVILVYLSPRRPASKDPCHIVATTEIKNSCGKSLSSEERGQPGAGLPLQGRGMRSLHPSRYFCPRIRYGGLNASLWKQLSGCRPALCALHCSSQGGQGRSVSVHRQPGAFTVVRETPALSRASTPGQGERGNLTN